MLWELHIRVIYYWNNIWQNLLGWTSLSVRPNYWCIATGSQLYTFWINRIEKLANHNIVLLIVGKKSITCVLKKLNKKHRSQISVSANILKITSAKFFQIPLLLLKFASLPLFNLFLYLLPFRRCPCRERKLHHSVFNVMGRFGP